jgi:3-hydroxyisobutyrate dehydrogenase-like beta-hydroxyacid dehydrogenase
MAEAATLAERYEIDPAKLMEVITETLFAAPAYATYSKQANHPTRIHPRQILDWLEFTHRDSR